MSSTLELCKELVSRPSITPDDAGCQLLMCERLSKLGFSVEAMGFENVDNFWARLGEGSPLIVFAGHTDVVPPGNHDDWASPPFQPTVRGGNLYGRGTADMKGALAAMITACERYLHDDRQIEGSIAFLITSDEEGVALNGTRRVMQRLQQRGEKIDYCIVGEPSSDSVVGDVIKVGRRGSLHGKLTLRGVQGHIAYPHLANNPIHFSLAPLAQLCTTQWDQGNEHFPPTSFQISNIHAGTGTDNVIPGSMEVVFNFRFSTELNEQEIKKRTTEIMDSHAIDYSIDWVLSGNPFLTQSGTLVETAIRSIKTVTGVETTTSTSGGTSDGRFIAPTGVQLIELGPCNATIHKVDEHVRIEDLDVLSAIYQNILEQLL